MKKSGSNGITIPFTLQGHHFDLTQQEAVEMFKDLGKKLEAENIDPHTFGKRKTDKEVAAITHQIRHGQKQKTDC